MKIELKNIKHLPSLSEETEAFTANIYIDGKHVGFAKNHGHGGSTDYTGIDADGWIKIREAEKYCKELPPEQCSGSSGMEPFPIDMDLERYIDDLLNKYLTEKESQHFNNRLLKAMQNGVVYGVPGEGFGGFLYKVPLTTILNGPNGAQIIQRTIKEKVVSKLRDGNIILNTNIPETILKAAGLKEEQYVKPEAIEIASKTSKRKQSKPKL